MENIIHSYRGNFKATALNLFFFFFSPIMVDRKKIMLAYNPYVRDRIFLIS